MDIFRHSQFKKDYKKFTKSGYRIKERTDLLKYILNELIQGYTLDRIFNDHPLTGKWRDFRECHIEPDFLLIYKINKHLKIIELARIASHSELFD